MYNAPYSSSSAFPDLIQDSLASHLFKVPCLSLVTGCCGSYCCPWCFCVCSWSPSWSCWCWVCACGCRPTGTHGGQETAVPPWPSSTLTATLAAGERGCSGVQSGRCRTGKLKLWCCSCEARCACTQKKYTLRYSHHYLLLGNIVLTQQPTSVQVRRRQLCGVHG